MGRNGTPACVLVEEWVVSLQMPAGSSPAAVQAARAEASHHLEALCRALRQAGLALSLESEAPDPSRDVPGPARVPRRA